MQLIFASITIYCSLLLCDCYRYPDPVTVRLKTRCSPGAAARVCWPWSNASAGSQGERCYTYTMSVRRYLGARVATGMRPRAPPPPPPARCGTDAAARAGTKYVIFCGVAQYLNLVATGAAPRGPPWPHSVLAGPLKGVLAAAGIGYTGACRQAPAVRPRPGQGAGG